MKTKRRFGCRPRRVHHGPGAKVERQRVRRILKRDESGGIFGHRILIDRDAGVRLPGRMIAIAENHETVSRSKLGEADPVDPCRDAS